MSNGEANLIACFKRFAEIVVIDSGSGSMDKTCEIAKAWESTIALDDERMRTVGYFRNRLPDLVEA